MMWAIFMCKYSGCIFLLFIAEIFLSLLRRPQENVAPAPPPVTINRPKLLRRDSVKEQIEQRPMYTFLFFVSVYILKEVFLQPGCSFLNFVTEILYGDVQGILLMFICFLSACASTGLFLLSKNSVCAIFFNLFDNYIQRTLESKLETATQNRKYQILLQDILLSLSTVWKIPCWIPKILAVLTGMTTYKFFLSIFLGSMVCHLFKRSGLNMIQSIQLCKQTCLDLSYFSACVIKTNSRRLSVWKPMEYYLS